ncbi:hypothetical protein B0T25DRAFT_556058 [Lasiosphaeria hispida]|uniref:Uncharacterized protein n=1 Tax=Lasiosphaeria hispida TaxID=260671 RepID=A0AAJ0M9N6_9PEZI|nr:hypothetical protein B0T25DRAFT_556058 [Lasiosphaeria hispida]
MHWLLLRLRRRVQSFKFLLYPLWLWPTLHRRSAIRVSALARKFAGSELMSSALRCRRRTTEGSLHIEHALASR